MFKKTFKHRFSVTDIVRIMLLSAVFALAACSSSDDDDDGDSSTEDDTFLGAPEFPEGPAFAFVAAAAPDFSAGQVERIVIDDVVMADGAFPATLSDIRVATDGTDVYQVGRFGIESITRFSPDDLETPIFQFSTAQGGSPNTQEIVFASETKAYVLQSSSPSILIVNPAATTEAEFITGSIDISDYDAEGEPDAIAGVIVDGRLFVLMQRLLGFAPFNMGAVAVFDTESDVELEIGLNFEGLNGIVLGTTNPEGLQYVEEFNELVVTSRGNLFSEFNEVPGDPYQGGLETIDADTFAVNLLLDDGTQESNDGFFNASLVTSAERGYVVTTGGFQNNTLRSFSPLTGLLDEGVVAGLEGMDLTTLANGPRGLVWVGVGGDTPGFYLLDPADNSIVGDLVATQFIPNDIVFLESSN